MVVVVDKKYLSTNTNGFGEKVDIHAKKMFHNEEILFAVKTSYQARPL